MWRQHMYKAFVIVIVIVIEVGMIMCCGEGLQLADSAGWIKLGVWVGPLVGVLVGREERRLVVPSKVELIATSNNNCPLNVWNVAMSGSKVEEDEGDSVGEIDAASAMRDRSVW